MGSKECELRHSTPKPMQKRSAGLHPIITIKNTLKVYTVFHSLRTIVKKSKNYWREESGFYTLSLLSGEAAYHRHFNYECRHGQLIVVCWISWSNSWEYPNSWPRDRSSRSRTQSVSCYKSLTTEPQKWAAGSRPRPIASGPHLSFCSEVVPVEGSFHVPFQTYHHRYL